MTEHMKLAQAQKLNAEGKLTRRVLTERGWYVPKMQDAPAPKHDTDIAAPPQVFRRRPGGPKKMDVI